MEQLRRKRALAKAGRSQGCGVRTPAPLHSGHILIAAKSHFSLLCVHSKPNWACLLVRPFMVCRALSGVQRWCDWEFGIKLYY